MGFRAHFLLVRLPAGEGIGAPGGARGSAVVAVARSLLELVSRTVEGMGYELVDLERAGGGLLRVTLDAPDAPRGVTIADCERVSHQLTHLFAVEGVDYGRLEVGSPGLDRPLRTAREFRRFIGAEIRVQLRSALDGRRRLHGRLVDVGGPDGDERIAIDVRDEAGQAGGRSAQSRPAGSRKRGSAGAAPKDERLRRVQFALADVDKARLVPKLDFRSGQS
jgi:ribosome maturation factor RimP